MDDGHELPIDSVEDLHIHTLNTIKLPPDTAVLYSAWDPEYGQHYRQMVSVVNTDYIWVVFDWQGVFVFLCVCWTKS